MRRWNEYAQMLKLPGDQLRTRLGPALLSTTPIRRMAEAKSVEVPAKITGEAIRPGDWDGRNWASGFMLCVEAFHAEWFALGGWTRCMKLAGTGPDGRNSVSIRSACKIRPGKMLGRRAGFVATSAALVPGPGRRSRKPAVTRRNPKVGRKRSMRRVNLAKKIQEVLRVQAPETD